MTTTLVRTSANFNGDEPMAVQQEGVTYAPVKLIYNILGLVWTPSSSALKQTKC